MKKTPNSISANIRKHRLLHSMTQEEVASKLNIDTQYYAQLERGERNFTIEKLIQLCAIFQVGIEDIIEVETETPAGQNTDLLVNRIVSGLDGLSYAQLAVIEKFMAEIVPYMK